jgi:sugar lactone lactonase YvrE
VILALALIVAWSAPADAIQHGDLLVTDRASRSLLVVNPVTGAQAVLSTGGFFSEPEAVVANAAGRIFVVEADRFGAGSKIVEVNRITGAQSVLASGGIILDPNDIAIEASGMLVVADFSGPSGLGGILRINPANARSRCSWMAGPLRPGGRGRRSDRFRHFQLLQQLADPVR